MGDGGAAGGAGAGVDAGAGVGTVGAVEAGGAAEEDELEGLGIGGDLGSGPLKDEFGPWGCEESRRSPLRGFLPPRPLRPPSKLLSCCPKAVSEGRWGDGLEGPASLGPRSFLLRFGGIVESIHRNPGHLLRVRRDAGGRLLSQSEKCQEF
jgi:hypothetical protein